MAGRLLPPDTDTGPALGEEDAPRLQAALQVSPQPTGTRVGVAGGCHLHPFAPPPPKCQPLPVPQVPIIRHRGSNTLNFHFHDPESFGTAGNGQGAPKSSGTALSIPGDSPGGPLSDAHLSHAHLVPSE